MKSRIIKNYLKEQTLSMFLEEHDLMLEICERPTTEDHARYYAHIKGAEVMENGCLSSFSGNGSTPQQAVEEYCEKITFRRLAIKAYTIERREFNAPQLRVDRAIVEEL